MVLEYWPTKLGHVWCKCSNIFHKYDLGEFPWFLDACIMNMSHVFHWNILGTALKRTGQYNLWRLWWHGRMCHDRTASWPKGIPPFVAMKIVALLFYPVITIYIYTHIYIYIIYILLPCLGYLEGLESSISWDFCEISSDQSSPGQSLGSVSACRWHWGQWLILVLEPAPGSLPSLQAGCEAVIGRRRSASEYTLQLKERYRTPSISIDHIVHFPWQTIWLLF